MKPVKKQPPRKKFEGAKSVLPPQKLDYRWPLLVAVVSFLLYVNTIRNQYVMDDWGAITGNQFVQKGLAGIPDLLKVDFWYFTNINLGYYRPLPPITFAIEQQYFPGNPHVSHFINTFFYALTGFVVCLLLLELFRNYSKWFAVVISLLFVAHPIHTEVIGNLKSRDEIFSFLGTITMLCLMVRYGDTKKKKIYTIISFVIFYLALLSKETAFMGIVLLPVTLYFFRGKSLWTAFKSVLPFVLALVLFYVQKYSMMKNPGGPLPVDIINYPYIKTQFGSSMVIFANSIKLLLFPHPLLFNYSYNQIPAGTVSNPWTWIGFILFVFLIYYAIREFIRKSVLGYGLAVFFITAIPAFAFVLTRGGIMAERFFYGPSFGFSIAFVYIICKAFSIDYHKDLKWAPLTKKKPASLALVVAVFAAYSFKTVDRNKDWFDNFTISKADITYSENNSQCNFVLGSDYIAKAEVDSVHRMEYFNLGVQHLKQAVSIAPRYGAAWCNLARAYQVIKYIPDSALYYYRKSNEAYANGYYVSYNNMGMIFEDLGKLELASYYYNKSIESNPTFPDAHANAERLKQTRGLDVRVYPGGE